MKHGDVRKILREWMRGRGYESLFPLEHNRYGMIPNLNGGWTKDPKLEILPKEWWYRRSEGKDSARRAPQGARPDDVFHYVGGSHLAFPDLGGLVILEYKAPSKYSSKVLDGIGQCLHYYHKSGIPVYLVVEGENYKKMAGTFNLTFIGIITYHRELNPNRVTIAKFWGR